MILGSDVSFYQDNDNTPQQIDFSKMKSGGMNFTIIRAGQGSKVDPDLAYNLARAKQDGLPFGVYWLYEYRSGLNPGLEHQANLFIKAVNDSTIPHFLDFERPNSTWEALPNRDTCLSIIKTFFGILENSGVTKLGLYCNLDFLKNTLKALIPEWLLKYPLWLASYPYAVFDYYPTTPTYTSIYNWKVHFWQFTDRLDGSKYGVESKQIDGDYYLLSTKEFNTFFNIEDTTPLPDTPLNTVRPIYPNQYARSGPGIQYPTLGYIEQSELQIIDTYIVEEWIKVYSQHLGKEVWIAKTYSGQAMVN